MRRPVVALAVAAALTVLLWFLPFARVIARPLLWWSTLAHEAGHGVVAVLAGGTWERLQLFADGSGVATSRYGEGVGGFVALGGLVGPAFAALGLFVAGAFVRPARFALGALGLLVLALLPTVASGLFTVVFVVGAGALLVVAAARASPKAAQVGLLFLAVQLALSVFSGADYLFASSAVTGAGTMPSDVAQVVARFGGAIPLWGGAIAAFSVLVLVLGLAFLLAVDRVVVVVDRGRAARAGRPAASAADSGGHLH
jgi:hypothetical protein